MEFQENHRYHSLYDGLLVWGVMREVVESDEGMVRVVCLGGNVTWVQGWEKVTEGEVMVRVYLGMGEGWEV